MPRRNAQVEERTRERLCARFRGVGEIRAHYLHPLPVLLQPLFCHREGLRVLVHTDYACYIAGFEYRFSVSPSTERAVEKDATSYRFKKGEDLSHHDGDMVVGHSVFLT